MSKGELVQIPCCCFVSNRSVDRVLLGGTAFLATFRPSNLDAAMGRNAENPATPMLDATMRTVASVALLVISLVRILRWDCRLQIRSVMVVLLSCLPSIAIIK